VCSSFALRRSIITDYRARIPAGVLRSGDLETRVVPSLANQPLTSLPRELTLTHCQTNTMPLAMSAIYWNGRADGDIHRRGATRARLAKNVALPHLRRAWRLARQRRFSPAEVAAFSTLGWAFYAGFWVGYVAGPGQAAARLRAAHPRAA
jgi:hypothetical protein